MPDPFYRSINKNIVVGDTSGKFYHVDIVDYGDPQPKEFPFNMGESYEIRIASFAAGAKLAIENDPTISAFCCVV